LKASIRARKNEYERILSEKAREVQQMKEKMYGLGTR
jgi:hypothetical protein